MVQDERMQPERQLARWKHGWTSTERTLTPQKGRRSCWPSSPRWHWPRCPLGLQMPDGGWKRRIKWLGRRVIGAMMMTTQTTSKKVLILVNNGMVSAHSEEWPSYYSMLTPIHTTHYRPIDTHTQIVCLLAHYRPFNGNHSFWLMAMFDTVFSNRKSMPQIKE